MSRSTTKKESRASLSPLPKPVVLQRKCDCGQHTIAGEQCESCKSKGSSNNPLQRVATGAGLVNDVPPIVDEVLRSPGQPLDKETRDYFEPRFGHDFSQVRVHTDSKASESANAINARAFTLGSDIVFSGSSGLREKHTLAHELSHVVQQSQGSALPSSGLKVGPSDTSHEREADSTARAVLSSTVASPVALSAAQPALQRTNGDPPNKLVPLSKDPAEKHEASDAVVSDFQSAATTIQSETGIDLTKGPGDTVREMGSKTSKVGASNFSWHKTGRAIDINQGHKWVILKEPADDGMRFRLFLEKTATTPGARDRKFTKEEKPDFHHNPFGKKVYEKTFIDVTQILFDMGFNRIPAQTGWEKSYNKREWWHYEKRDSKTMYQALQDIYTEEQIVSGYSTLVTPKKTGKASTESLVRLHREGFPYETIQDISPKTPNAERTIELSVSRAAVKKKDFDEAALYLNGLNTADIKRELKKLKPAEIQAILWAAIMSPAIGSRANLVAVIQEHCSKLKGFAADCSKVSTP